jgi:hypothetical protein
MALYIMLGLGTLVVVATGIAAWLFFRSEQGQKVVKAVSESMTVMQQATQAPGTTELRKAGCTQAMVLHSAELLEKLGEIFPEAPKEIPDSAGGTFVMCQINSNTEGLDCPAVARIYAKAVPDAPESFGVMVQSQRVASADTKCQGTYARDGTFLGSLEQK